MENKVDNYDNYIEARTLTYATNKDGAMRLMLKVPNTLFEKVEVSARVDKISGEVKFFVAEEDLQKLLGD